MSIKITSYRFETGPPTIKTKILRCNSYFNIECRISSGPHAKKMKVTTTLPTSLDINGKSPILPNALKHYFRTCGGTVVYYTAAILDNSMG